MMNRERLDQFHFRFGIIPGEDAFKRFQVRVVHAVNASLRVLEDRERFKIEEEFGLRNGSKVIFSDNLVSVYVAHGIIDELQGAKSFPQLIERAQHILWAFESFGLFGEEGNVYSSRENAGLKLVAELQKAIELSPGVDVRMQVMADRVEFVPAGIKLMDDAVDQVTQWLFKYPDVQKEFRQTLAILAEKRHEQYRQAQDSLRFALEKLLKHLLNNNVPLEEQGKGLKEWLAQRGVTEGLRSAVVQVMLLLNKHYQNAAVKHDNAVGDGNMRSWADYEVEYLLYQQTTLLRLLLEASEAGERP